MDLQEKGFIEFQRVLIDNEEINNYGNALTATDYEFKNARFNNPNTVYCYFKCDDQAGLLNKFAGFEAEYGREPYWGEKKLKRWIFILFFYRAMDLLAGKYMNEEFVTPENKIYKLCQADIFMSDTVFGCSLRLMNKNDDNDKQSVTIGSAQVSVDLHDLLATQVQMVTSKAIALPLKSVNKTSIAEMLDA